MNLTSGRSGLERLADALTRLEQRHAFTRVSDAASFAPSGPAVLLLTDDPQRFPEVLDATVILPEALKGAASEGLQGYFADASVSPALAQRYAVTRYPAVVFLRGADYLGCLSGIRDWAEYQAEVARLLAGPAQPKPIAIPVNAAPGACA